MDTKTLENQGWLIKDGPEEWKVNAQNPKEPGELVIRLEEHPESGKKLPIGGAYVIYDDNEMLSAHGRLEDAIEEIKGWGFVFPEMTMPMGQILDIIWNLKEQFKNAREEDIPRLNKEWDYITKKYRTHPQNPGLQRVPPVARDKPSFAKKWASGWNSPLIPGHIFDSEEKLAAALEKKGT